MDVSRPLAATREDSRPGRIHRGYSNGRLSYRRIEVHDPQEYEEYKEKASSTGNSSVGATWLTVEDQEVLEGSWTPTRLVMLEFPDATSMVQLKRVRHR